MRRSAFFAPLPVAVVVALGLALFPVAPASANPVPAAAGVSVAAQAAVAPAAGTFNRLAPIRMLDTRSGLGAAGPVGARGTIGLRVLGRASVPLTNVAAVALTVTATRSGGAGYLTVYPDGASRPVASNLNFAAGQSVANMVIVPVGANGVVRLYNGGGTTVDMIADIAGYFTAGTPSTGGSFRALSAQRLLDTRSVAPLSPNTAVAVRAAGAAGVPSAGVASVVVNLTATRAGASGFLTAYASGTARPNVSSLNFSGAASVANLAVVPVGADGRIAVFSSSAASVDVLVDIVGYFVAGTPSAPGAFSMVATRRILDTRTSAGGPGRLSTGASTSLKVKGTAGIPTSPVSAVVMNLTAVAPISFGHLTVYPGKTSRPNTSNLNFTGRQTIAALVTVPVGSDGTVSIYNGGGATDVVADVVGYYVGSSPTTCNQVPTDPAGTSVTRWNPMVTCVLGMLGAAQSASNVSDVDIVIRYESSGDPNAINNWDSNAQAGHPSQGLVQVIQPTFDYYRSPSLPSNLLNPAANVYAGMHYAIATYGSIHNIPGLVSLRNGGGYKGYLLRK